MMPEERGPAVPELARRIPCHPAGTTRSARSCPSDRVPGHDGAIIANGNLYCPNRAALTPHRERQPSIPCLD